MPAHVTLDARPGWTEGLKDQLPPGAHVAVLGARHGHCVEGRRAGLEFRDTILLVTAKGFSAAALFRIPLEGTVATQVTKTSTGALWIDGCRVAGTPRTTHADGSTGARSGYHQGWAEPLTKAPPPDGRWPSNLILVHEPGCRCEGVKKVKPGNGSGKAVRHKGVSNAVAYGGNIGRLAVGTPDLGYVAEDGTESVAAWSCAPGCPVAALDEMSGDRKSAGNYPTTYSNGGGFTHGDIGKGFQGPLYDDAGGASRFYPQTEGPDQARAWISRLIGGPS